MLSTDAGAPGQAHRPAAGPPLADVLEEHLEETGFLLLQRRKLLFSPDLPLRRLLRHETRVDAHLDALRVGGPASIGLALARLNDEDPWFAAAARRVWLELGAPSGADVTRRIEDSPDELLPSWREAFRDLPAEDVEAFFPAPELLRLPSKVQAVAADTLGWHRRLPESAALPLAAGGDPAVRLALARHAASPPLLETLAKDAAPDLRNAALWSIALTHSGRGLQLARALVPGDSPDAFPVRVLGLLGVPEDGTHLEALLSVEALTVPILCALGDLGDPSRAPSLLARLQDEREDIAAAALEALEKIAGRAGGPGREEDRTDWEAALARLSPGVRHLRGQPFPPESFEEDPSMETLWRLAVAVPVEEAAWLRRHVPDGFFSGISCPESLPGE